MATISQIRGLLLEEVVLALLAKSGFRTIENAGADPTLSDGPAGLQVIGRGGIHQADAVADFRVIMPFGYPARLVVEAKCYSRRTNVGLPVVRNAVGVLKDIAEYFVPGPRPEIPSRARYHYRYAIFSATDFTREAQRYAFAQDIYLVPLARNTYMQPALSAIREISHPDFGALAWNQIEIDLHEFRMQTRRLLRHQQALPEFSDQSMVYKVGRLIERIGAIGGTLLGRANQHFPIYLTPMDSHALDQARTRRTIRVTIRYDQRSWYLIDEQGTNLFSFDLPTELFLMYADSGVLTRTAALDLKQEHLGEIQALYADGELVQPITFRLDWDWVERVRSQIVPS